MQEVMALVAIVCHGHWCCMLHAQTRTLTTCTIDNTCGVELFMPTYMDTDESATEYWRKRALVGPKRQSALHYHSRRVESLQRAVDGSMTCGVELFCQHTCEQASAVDEHPLCTGLGQRSSSCAIIFLAHVRSQSQLLLL